MNRFLDVDVVRVDICTLFWQFPEVLRWWTLSATCHFLCNYSPQADLPWDMIASYTQWQSLYSMTFSYRFLLQVVSGCLQICPDLHPAKRQYYVCVLGLSKPYVVRLYWILSNTCQNWHTVSIVVDWLQASVSFQQCWDNILVVYDSTTLLLSICARDCIWRALTVHSACFLKASLMHKLQSQTSFVLGLMLISVIKFTLARCHRCHKG